MGATDSMVKGFKDDDAAADFIKGNPFGVKREVLEEIQGSLRAKRGLAAMWPFVAAISNPESLSKADADFAARIASAAAQVAAADAAAAYAANAARIANADAVEIMGAAARIAATPRSPADVDVCINYEREIKKWSEKARKALGVLQGH